MTSSRELFDVAVFLLPNLFRLGQVRDTNFNTNVSDKMLLNSTKCQGYSFYRFWVIKGKLTRASNYLPDPCTPRLVLKQKLRKQHYHLTELIIIMCLKVFLMMDLLLYKTSLNKTAWQFRNLIMVTLWELLTGKIT